MKYKIHYAMKRLGKYYTDTFNIRTKLEIDDTTKMIIQYEIEEIEMTDIIILEIENG